MKKIIFLLGITAMFSSLKAQSPKDFFVIPDGNSLAIYLTFSPRSNNIYDVYRKTDSGFVKVNSESIRAEINATNAAVRLTEDWELLTKSFSTDDKVRILRGIRGNDFSASLLSLLSKNVAKVAGRLSYDKDVKLGPDYTYKIIFSSVSGVKKDSIIKTVSTKLNPPESPLNLKVRNENNQIILDWKYPKWKGDYSDLGFQYNVYRQLGNGIKQKINDEIIVRDEYSLPSYFDLSAEVGKTYNYSVTILDPVGNESKPSNSVTIEVKDVLAPKMISNVETKSFNKGIALTWAMSSEIDVIGYNIYRSEIINGEATKLNKNFVKADFPYFLDSTIIYDKQFFYSVTAVDGSGNESKKSNQYSGIWKDVVKPNAPEIISVKPENGFVKFSWKKLTGKDEVGVVIYRGLDSNRTSIINEANLTSTTFVDSGYKNSGYNYGEKLHYYVSVIDSSKNESEKLHFVIDVPDVQPPVLPTNFKVDNKNGIYVEIYSNSSSSKDVAKYIVYKTDNSGKQSIFREIESAPISVRDSNVVKGKTYKYAISAIDLAGNKSKNSNSKDVFVRDFNPPPSPKNLRAKLKNKEVTIYWGKVVDFDLLGYNVYSSKTPSGTYTLLNKEPIQDLSFADKKGTKANFYRVLAVDTSGNESKYEKNIAVK